MKNKIAINSIVPVVNIYPINSIDRSQYYSTIEAAKKHSCSVPYLWKCIKIGKLPAIQVRQRTRIISLIPKEIMAEFAKRYMVTNARVDREMTPSLVCRKPIKSNGYVYIFNPDHSLANCHGYVAEHVLVMEEKLGRDLKRGENVHHINSIRHDNRPENLEIFVSLSAHLKQGHGLALALTKKLSWLLSSRTTNLQNLKAKEKIELFDMLVESL
jgi:hypothetical protein